MQDRKTYEINLKELIEDYIWKEYKSQLPFYRRMFFRKDRHYIDIRWGYLDFQHETIPDKDQEPEGMTKTDEKGKKKGDKKKKNYGSPIDLYVAEYENETDTDQTYTFSATRDTTSRTTVTLQETYTLGAETNLSVQLGVFSLGGRFSGSMSVSDTKGEERSTTQSWNVNTLISVPKRRRATAKLEVKEITRTARFTLKTVIRLQNENLPVSIRRISDDKIVKTYWILSLRAFVPASFIKENKDKIALVDEPSTTGGNIKENIHITTHGVFRDVSAKEQRVVVEYKPLSSASKPGTSGWTVVAGNDAVPTADVPVTGDAASGEQAAGDTEDSDSGQGKTNGTVTEVQPLLNQ